MRQKRFLANELHDLKVEEVSLVPRGANRKRFLLLKSALGGDSAMYDETLLDRVLSTDLENESEIEETLKAQGLSDKARNAVKGALRLLNAYRDELPPDIINTLASLAGYGYQPPPLPASDEVKAARSQPKQYGGYGGNDDEYEYGYGEGKGKKGKPKPSAAAEERARKDELVRKAALGLVTDRDQAWEGMRRAAKAMFGRDDALGIDLLMQTELGLELYRSYLNAPVAPPPAPVTKSAAQDQDVPAWAEIEALAEQLVQKSSYPLTKEQAVSRVLDSPRGCQLYRLYLSQKAALAARRK
jgi:hypothetical protein